MSLSPTQTAPLEAGNRVRLPAEWAEALGLRGHVCLERTSEGILIRPAVPVSWEETFATKLSIGSTPANANDEALELTGDDLLF